jgi:hypothetical protein
LADFEVVTIPLAHAGFVERGDLAECFGSSSCAAGADNWVVPGDTASVQDGRVQR